MPSAAMSAVGGALLWGTLGPAAVMLTDQDRLAAGAIRLLLGALTMVILGAGRISLRGWRRRDVLPVVTGAVGVAGFQLAYFGAVGLGGVAVSTAVSIGLSPVFTGLWTAVRSRRRLSVVWVVGTAIAMGGLLLLAFGGGHEVPVSVSGLVLAVLAALCFSMQVSSIQTLATRHGDATALTAMFAVGAVALIPVTVLTATSNLIAAGNAFWILYLGVVTTGVAYWLFSRGVRHVGAAAGTTISLLEPVAAAVIAAVALNEAVSLAQWIGIVAICAAVLAISFRPTFSVREADQLVEEFA